MDKKVAKNMNKISPTQIETQNIKTPKHHAPKHHKTNVNGWRQIKCRVHKENNDWKEDYITIPSETKMEKVKVETEKVNKLIPPVNITELNGLIYAGATQVCDKIGLLQRNPNSNTKSRWEIKLVRLIKKLWQQPKEPRKEKHIWICWN